MKFVFSRNRKWDVDMIWDHNRYLKAYPGSTLQGSNNGLTISDDMGRKACNFEANKKNMLQKADFQLF